MVHGKNRIPYRIDRRLTGLAALNMMPPSRFGWPLSLKTVNRGNPVLSFQLTGSHSRDVTPFSHSANMHARLAR